ncbi:MAG: hypothetical protein V4652_13250 [Bacteroidota bacterium]
MRSTIVILLTLAFISCKNSNDISFVVESINNCSEGSNQSEVDEKAYFDEESKSLIIYIGENHNRSLKKWIIPLSELSPENVSYQNTDFPQILTVIPNGLKKIKYYQNEIENDSVDEFAYNIHDYCLDKKSIEKFIQNYRNGISKIKE